jgi:hypothetical protein
MIINITISKIIKAGEESGK